MEAEGSAASILATRDWLGGDFRGNRENALVSDPRHWIPGLRGGSAPGELAALINRETTERGAPRVWWGLIPNPPIRPSKR